MSLSAVLVLFAFFSGNLAIGIFFYARRRSKSGRLGEDAASFFLADRSLGAFVLFLTLAATNFSAFTVFGVSGAGYRTGYAYFPLMALGTGLMASSFFLIGMPLRKISAERGFMTQSDFISYRFGSPALGKFFSLALIAITVPYLSVQASAGGMMIERLSGIPARWGSLAVTGFILAYSLLGGMRSVAWTDVFQGFALLLLCLLGMFLIAAKGGGWVSTHRAAMAAFPDHYSLPGAGGGIGSLDLLGFFALWFLADPVFPQLSQRFMAAKDDRALGRSAALYPATCGIIFLCTVSIGVMGRTFYPGLDPAVADSVYPRMLADLFSPALAAILGLGGIAALMSTMDSQMLTVSSMAVKDFLPERRRTGRAGKIALCALAAASYAVSLAPPASIFDFLQKISFNGYAALAPAIIGGLYWKKANRLGAFASAFMGLLASVLVGFGILRPPFPSIFIILAASTLALTLGSVPWKKESDDAAAKAVSAEAPRAESPKRYFSGKATILTALIVGAAFLPYAWHRGFPVVLGLPAWIWFEFLLCIMLSLVFRAENRRLNTSPE